MERDPAAARRAAERDRAGPRGRAGRGRAPWPGPPPYRPRLPHGVGEVVMAQAHQRDSHRTRGQHDHRGQEQAHGGGYPRPGRIGQQNGEGSRQGEHPCLMSAGKAQVPHEGPIDQGLENEFGDARRRGHDHGHQHGCAPPSRHQAGQGKPSGDRDNRRHVTERSQVVQNSPVPETGLDPGVNRGVERSRLAMVGEQRSKEYRGRHAYDE